MASSGLSVLRADEVLIAWGLGIDVYYGPLEWDLCAGGWVAYVAICDIPLIQAMDSLVSEAEDDT